MTHLDRGQIYVFREEYSNYYKIGKSVNGRGRGKQLKTGNHRELRLIFLADTDNQSEVESAIHRALSGYRVKEGGGKEWFKVPNSDIVLDTVSRHLINPRQERTGNWFKRTSHIERRRTGVNLVNSPESVKWLQGSMTQPESRETIDPKGGVYPIISYQPTLHSNRPEPSGSTDASPNRLSSPRQSHGETTDTLFNTSLALRLYRIVACLFVLMLVVSFAVNSVALFLLTFVIGAPTTLVLYILTRVIMDPNPARTV